jgi:hypothetical protein
LISISVSHDGGGTPERAPPATGFRAGGLSVDVSDVLSGSAIDTPMTKEAKVLATELEVVLDTMDGSD